MQKLYDTNSVLLKGKKNEKNNGKNQYLESILHTTSFHPSALPAMFDFYKDYPADRVELLCPCPIGIMVMSLNGLIERFLSERIMIVTGLLIMSACAFVSF